MPFAASAIALANCSFAGAGLLRGNLERRRFSGSNSFGQFSPALIESQAMLQHTGSGLRSFLQQVSFGLRIVMIVLFFFFQAMRRLLARRKECADPGYRTAAAGQALLL